MTPQAIIYDYETQTTQSIPTAELAPNMILAEVIGVGRVWVDATKLKQSPIQHATLPSHLLRRANELFNAFQIPDGKRFINFLKQSRQEWCDGFKRDVHPDREIKVWEKILKFFRVAHQYHGGKKSLEWQWDAFLLSLAIHNNGPDNIRAVFNPKTMTKADAAELVEAFKKLSEEL